MIKLLALGSARSSGLPAGWEHSTPSCCLNPPLTKISHQHCRVGGEQLPAHMAKDLYWQCCRGKRLLGWRWLAGPAHRALGPLHPAAPGQPSRANSGHRSHRAVLVRQPWWEITMHNTVTLPPAPPAAPVHSHSLLQRMPLLTPGLQYSLTLPHAGTVLTPAVFSITCSVQRILNPYSASQPSEAPSNYISAMIKPSNVRVSTNKYKEKCPGLEAQHRSGQNPPTKNFHITNLSQRKP